MIFNTQGKCFLSTPMQYPEQLNSLLHIHDATGLAEVVFGGVEITTQIVGRGLVDVNVDVDYGIVATDDLIIKPWAYNGL